MEFKRGDKWVVLMGVAIVVWMLVGLADSTAQTVVCSPTDNPATVQRWVDGDTAVLTVDLGWNVLLKDQKIRLARVNTPERGQTDFDAATALSRATCPVSVVVRNKGLDKYGRWVVEMNCNGVNLNDLLRSRGWVYNE